MGAATGKKGGRSEETGKVRENCPWRKVKVGASSKGGWEPSISRVLRRRGQDHTALKEEIWRKNIGVCARAAEMKRNGKRDELPTIR